MLKLIYRDLFIYQRNNLFVLPFFAILFTVFAGQAGHAMYPAFVVMLPFAFTMTANTAFAFDDAYKINRFLRATPLTPLEIVASRYSSCMISGIAGTLCVLLATAGLNFVSRIILRSDEFARDIWPGIGFIIMCIGGTLLYCSLLMPVVYKFSYIKMKYLMLLLFMLLAAGGPMLIQSDAVRTVADYFIGMTSSPAWYVIFGLLSIASVYGSLRLSAYILRTKEE